ncbi:hypothetical protein J6590_010838 [Homalodisca vitripennis]|nr:hypothetical protein J6590_010838 [Homalodisca vitripennis]
MCDDEDYEGGGRYAARHRRGRDRDLANARLLSYPRPRPWPNPSKNSTTRMRTMFPLNSILPIANRPDFPLKSYNGGMYRRLEEVLGGGILVGSRLSSRVIRL